ncbi:MAG: O-antigen ligase family protein, partial [Pleurocapsa sp.]
AIFWTSLSDKLYDRPVETLRISQWVFCWDKIKERPFGGWGLRNFSPLYEAKTNYWFGHPHSLYLMLGAETGIVSSLLLMGFVGLIMYRATILLLNWTFDSSKLIYFSYTVVFFCCVLFNFLDVTIFDLRVNTIIWIILAAIGGIAINNKQST